MNKDAMLEEAERFSRQYQQRLDLRQLTWPSAATLKREKHQERIWLAIEEMQRDGAYPQYDQRILKELTKRIEDAVKDEEDPVRAHKYYYHNAITLLACINTLHFPCDINSARNQTILDTFAELSATLLTTPTSPNPETTYIHARYHLPWPTPSTSSPHPSPTTLTILENPRLLAAAGCTGHRTWEAALYLATLLGASPYFLPRILGARVLELGAGTGLVSLACAALGAVDVLATDGDEGAVRRMEGVVGRSGGVGQGKVRCEVLLWGDEEGGGQEEEEEGVDVVVAADVTYDPGVMPELVATLVGVLRRWRGAFVVVAATLRNVETVSVFEGECARRGLVVTRVSDEELGLDTAMEGMGAGGVGRGDVRLQRGFFHAPATEIVIMRITPGAEFNVQV